MAVKKRSDKKKPPRAARKGKRWEIVGEVGDWTDAVPSKEETRALKKAERELGLLKLDRDIKVREGRLEVKAPDVALEVLEEVKDGKPDRMPRVRD